MTNWNASTRNGGPSLDSVTRKTDSTNTRNNYADTIYCFAPSRSYDQEQPPARTFNETFWKFRTFSCGRMATTRARKSFSDTMGLSMRLRFATEWVLHATQYRVASSPSSAPALQSPRYGCLTVRVKKTRRGTERGLGYSSGSRSSERLRPDRWLCGKSSYCSEAACLACQTWGCSQSWWWSCQTSRSRQTGSGQHRDSP